MAQNPDSVPIFECSYLLIPDTILSDIQMPPDFGDRRLLFLQIYVTFAQGLGSNLGCFTKVDG